MTRAKENCDLFCSKCDYDDREEGTCCICGGEFKEWGNNPSPLVTTSCTRCCNVCNYEYVLKMRTFHSEIIKNARDGKSYTAKVSFDASGKGYAKYKKSCDEAMAVFLASEEGQKYLSQFANSTQH